MRTIIIAEAGVNHNGEIQLAKQLIDVAAQAGADYIKFQTWKSESVISKFAPKAEYQKHDSIDDESMLEMEKKLELSYDAFIVLKGYCKKKGIGFLSTPFDIESVHFLASLNLDLVKIPSGEITNLPFLEEVAKHDWKIILSTGMSELSEIEAAIQILGDPGRLTLLQCNTQYPTPYHDINLMAMTTLRNKFAMPVGISDHSLGIEVPIAAVALGAVIVEKHFTLDRGMIGPDHKASIEPNELVAMVRSIRNIEQAMGDGKKSVTESERENIAIARKSIVAKVRIRKGELFSSKNITTKRPGTGISPMRWYDVIGMKAQRDFEEDELIEIWQE